MERGGKEGQDRLLIRNQPTIFFRKKNQFPGPTPLKTLFWPLCASEVFWVWDLDGETNVSHCSIRRAEGGDEKSSVFCPSYIIPVSHTFKNFSSFALPMKASEATVPESPSRDRFARSGLLFFLVCCPAHLSDCLHLPVFHGPPFCPV